VLALTGTAEATEVARKTYANPLDIDYRYNFEQESRGISYRTGADPVIVRHGDAYYLFQTLADGYWCSTDLVDWRFIAPSRWPFDSMVAPAVISDGDRLLVMRSLFSPGAVLESRDPASGRFDFLTRMLPELPNAVPPGRDVGLPGWRNGDPQPERIPPGPWDPAFFKDDDGRWYLYWGSSDTFPLYGIALDMRQGMRYVGTPRALLALDPERHGWERFGQDHRGALFPDGTPVGNYMEGAWMTKVRGRYYLQYGAPGTEHNAYATGTYVGDSPLGPFEYAPYNPVGYKPGGFVQGAGHGSTFQDAYGNWWNTGTPWLGYNWTFERRIAMFPAAFSADGQMSVNARFGDFPHYVPDGPNADPEALFTGWMLLSWRKAVTASTMLQGHAASNVTDENPRTFWVAGRNEAGQTLTVDLGAAKTLRAVQVNFADFQSGRYGDADDIYTEFALEYSRDGRDWQSLAATGSPRRDRPNAYLQLPAPVDARYVRYVHGHVGAAHLAISDLRVFGHAKGRAPAAPRKVSARRDNDPRQAFISWQPVRGAVGYNVRWGVAPERLNLSYQVFADQPTTLELRALSRDVGYHVAVEAFDENGVSPLSTTIALP
jgi:hypothetical protein